MIIHYQLICIGDTNPLLKEVKDRFMHHASELGIDKGIIDFIDENNFDEYKSNSPGFCLYFGNESGDYKNLDLLATLQTHAALILPVVTDTEKFSASTPESLRGVNGFQLSASHEVESLVGNILEGLGLLRLTRRLFISYKRSESSAVAIQLFEQLEKAGFDVFLDTHSIRKSEPFQEELWHRLADTDVVVLLNTPGFLKSEWTKEELARANAMSIGILQVVWPDHKLERDAEISIPIQLKDTDFGNKHFSDSKSYLTDDCVNLIISQAESLRARSLAARQDNIITEFVSSAKAAGVATDLHPQKFITFKKTDGSDAIVIPTVGVPQAYTYNQSQELVTTIKFKHVKTLYLLYDHRYIREKWLKHLDWLDNYLPIKTVKIIGIEGWLKKI